MSRPYDELWGEPVRAQDVLDGREQAELRMTPLPARGPRLGVRRGPPVFPELQPGYGDREDSEGYEW